MQMDWVWFEAGIQCLFAMNSCLVPSVMLLRASAVLLEAGIVVIIGPPMDGFDWVSNFLNTDVRNKY